MDDRLQRRLREADPLASADGLAPAAERLDGFKEQIMRTEQRTVRTAFRPRPVGVVALGAASLAAVLIVGSLARPAATVLAWEPDPTPASDAQKAAAYAACTEGVQAVGSTGGSVNGGSGAPGSPVIPTGFPPLVSLELHGNGGVAILADEATVGYCLLKQDGDGFVYGGLTLQPARSGAPAGSMDVGAQTTDIGDMTLSIIAGTVPEGIASLRLDGGPGDGGTATVTGGRFAIWVPGPIMGGESTDLVALDASGAEIIRQPLYRGGERPVELEATPPGPKG
jgi:hypothetical protein